MTKQDGTDPSDGKTVRSDTRRGESAAEDATTGADALATREVSTTKLPLGRIKTPCSEIKLGEDPDFIQRTAASILSTHQELLSTRPKILQFAERVLGADGEKVPKADLADVIYCLNRVADEFVPSVEFGDGRAPKNLALAVQLQELVDGIVEFAKAHPKNTAHWDEGDRDRDPVDEPLTTFLNDKGLLLEGEAASVVGGQVKVFDRNEIRHTDYGAFIDGTRLLWNVGHDGGGYFTPGEGKSNIHFNCRLATGGFAELRADVDEFQTRLNRLVLAAIGDDTELAIRLKDSVPVIPVPERIADNLRTLRYAKQGSSGRYGSTRKGDILGCSKHGDSDTTYSAAQVINTNAVTDNSIAGGALGFNHDLVERFARARTLDDIHAVQQAIKLVSAYRAKLAAGYTDRFTCLEGPYDNPETPSNVFSWYFLDPKDLGGYYGYVKYPRDGIFSASEWLATTAGQLGENASYLDEVTSNTRRFLDGQMPEKLRTLISRAGSGQWLRREGRREGDFLSQVMELTREHWAEARSLRTAMRDFEYVLTWAGFRENCPVPVCTPEINSDRRELAISGGRNIALVLEDGASAETVIANDVRFGDDQKAILITGANGGGKTHLLEMLGNSVVYSHKGVDIPAERADLPLVTRFDFTVNASLHGEAASSFQGEMKQLIASLREIEQGFPGDVGMMLFDEPGRGTDKRDGIPLMIGLLKYLGDRGIYFGGSTHFNALGGMQAVFDRYGINIGVYTMRPGTFTLVEGPGRSYAIDTAKEFGLDPEIIETAESVAAQMDKLAIRLPERDAPEQKASSEFELVSPDVPVELGIYAEKKSTQGWGSHRQLAGASRVFAEYSPLRQDEYVRGREDDRDTLPALRPDAAEAFVAQLCRPLSNSERETRRSTIVSLQDGARFEDLLAPVGSLSNYLDLFCLYQGEKKKNADGVFDVMTTGLNAQARQDEGIAFDRFKSCVERVNLSDALDALQALVDNSTGLEACESTCREEIRSFLAGDDVAALREDIAKDPFLSTGQGGFELNDWREWVNTCVAHREALLKVNEAVLEFNFFGTVAKTLDKEAWARVQDVEEAGKIKIKDAVNTRLRYNVEEVTPIQIDFSQDRPIKIISGTNGGGKTQAQQTTSGCIYYSQQLGFAPAEEAQIGPLSNMQVIIGGAEHTQGRSSFQNEMVRIAEAIRAYKALGEPRGGFWTIDEPGKGTSEEEAIPILVGLADYCERRGIQLMMTTHFSGVFEALQKTRLAESYHPLYVDYFTPGERYALKEGVGSSSGIRIAEELGLPREIIDVAKEVAAYLRAQEGSATS